MKLNGFHTGGHTSRRPSGPTGALDFDGIDRTMGDITRATISEYKRKQRVRRLWFYGLLVVTLTIVLAVS